MAVDPPTDPQLRLLPLGDAALSVEVGEGISAQVSARVLALDAAVRAAAWPGVLETVPSYRALLIRVDPLVLPLAVLRARLTAVAIDRNPAVLPARVWTLPVCYDAAFGLDLDDLQQSFGLDLGQIIALHTAPTYLVYFLGFAPGFAYLGGLAPELRAPRRASPRPSVACGSVAIGGDQTAVFPLAMPSGWQVIGRSPVRLFDARLPEACLLRPGDGLRFAAIDRETFDDLEAQALRGAWQPQPQEAP